jgi:hypothetical protein
MKETASINESAKQLIYTHVELGQFHIAPCQFHIVCPPVLTPSSYDIGNVVQKQQW